MSSITTNSEIVTPSHSHSRSNSNENDDAPEIEVILTRTKQHWHAYTPLQYLHKLSVPLLLHECRMNGLGVDGCKNRLDLMAKILAYLCGIVCSDGRMIEVEEGCAQMDKVGEDAGDEDGDDGNENENNPTIRSLTKRKRDEQEDEYNPEPKKKSKSKSKLKKREEGFVKHVKKLMGLSKCSLWRMWEEECGDCDDDSEDRDFMPNEISIEWMNWDG
ncbi:hypothetical protein BELL_1071g00020 [Botrytis elliptica]|uniref:Uncharacterized protein n=1 Tax=Botrytis elliptica TaxID=278938 RepID=A0A4Z1IQK5_9HELO|nr:hypothetical protein BELL_1071g00020 [Botrytis elliptica]